MRTEEEMYRVIIDVAKNDERIRAVYMNGSRTNTNAPRDIFQDFDIVYVVTETESFIQDETWVTIFGDLLMLQEPEKMDQELGKDVDLSQSYGYLILFTDGNRIDLHIQTKEYMKKTYQEDSLTKPLLDKDTCLPPIPPANDKDYWTTKPTNDQYFATCNDFWWCMQNVAKGLWREELPYAKQMHETVIRPRLDQMISWWIGMHHDFQVSTGKMGKYFENYLPESYWDSYRNTYSDANFHNMWEAVFTTCNLFRTVAKDVAKSCDFEYCLRDDRNMTKYLKKVSELPKEAKGIY